MSEPRAGRFVTFEGGEGAGKSTLLATLAERARGDAGSSGGSRLLPSLGARTSEADEQVVTCREPGGTWLGERLREALLGAPSHEPPDIRAELLVFAAARAQIVAEVIRPALERGALVLCDRYADSMVAYQHYGRGIDREAVDAANAVATGGLMPDLTVLLDLPPFEGLRRVGRVTDYLEREPLDFHRRVRSGYLAEAEADSGRWLVLDATQPPEALAEAAWESVERLAEA